MPEGRLAGFPIGAETVHVSMAAPNGVWSSKFCSGNCCENAHQTLQDKSGVTR